MGKRFLSLDIRYRTMREPPTRKTMPAMMLNTLKSNILAIAVCARYNKELRLKSFRRVPEKRKIHSVKLKSLEKIRRPKKEMVNSKAIAVLKPIIKRSFLEWLAL